MHNTTKAVSGESPHDSPNQSNETRETSVLTASEMGKLGAQARIAKTTSEQRKTWARKAGKASGKARRKKIAKYFEHERGGTVKPK